MYFLCRSCFRSLHLQRRTTLHTHQKAWKHTSASSRPFRLAIIGSGPAGFYTASKVMREHDLSRVDMYEHLPVPYGLVRYGVAPDHPEVKNCQDRFADAAESPNFNFIGNINVGHDLALKTLKPHYDAIVFAYGASKDRRLGIPGENLDGVYSARDFVGWYNGLPGYAHLNPRLNQGSDAVIIGQGNVALDVARILLSNVDLLRKTDMPEYALDMLSRSRITNVHTVGRRGPMQAAFTIKEIRELANLSGTAFAPVRRDLLPEDLKTLPRAPRRLAELLVKSSSSQSTRRESSFSLNFLLSPTKFQSSIQDQNSLSSVNFQKTHYTEESGRFHPSAVVSTSPDIEPVNLPTSIAFRSIGYKSDPLPGLVDLNVRFDNQRGIIPNQLGRVVSQSDMGIDVTPPVPGLYVAGWVKRGPTGVIASTMEDAFATADSILHDVKSGQPLLNHEEGGSTGRGWDGVRDEAQRNDLRRTNWRDWKRIDEVEREKGRKLGKEREKFSDVAEMLSILDQ